MRTEGTHLTMTHALTPDITYNGLPLTQAQYDASMAILRRIEALGRVSAHDDCCEGHNADDNHVAWIAIWQGRLVREEHVDTKSPTITWHRITLTDLGRVYVAQRAQKP